MPTSTRPSSTWSTPGRSRSRARPTWPTSCEHAVDAGLLTATTDTAGGGRRRRGRRRGRPAVRRRATARPDFGCDGRAPPGHRGGSAAGHAGQLRDHAPGRHHPQPLGADARGGLRAWRRAATSTWSSARSGCSPAGSSPTCAGTRSWSAASTSGPPGAASSSTRRCSTSTSATTSPQPNGVWDLGSAEAAELAKLAETTYRDVNIGLANQFARYADTVGVDVDEGDRRLQLPAVQPHPPTRASPSAGTASRSTRGCTCGTTRPRPWCARPARPTRRCRRTRSTCSPRPSATWPASAVLVLGAAYRGGVKETAFSGVFPTVEALRSRGAVPLRHRPAVHRGRAARARAAAAQRGAGRGGSDPGRPRRVPQLTPADLPGVRSSSTAAGPPTRSSGPASAAW